MQALTATNPWGTELFLFFLGALSVLGKRKSAGVRVTYLNRASRFAFTGVVVGLSTFTASTLLKTRRKRAAWSCVHVFSGAASLSGVFCAVVAGPALTQPSLLTSRDQAGPSAVPSLAAVGARLPPPLPQNLLYTVSEREHAPRLKSA